MKHPSMEEAHHTEIGLSGAPLLGHKEESQLLGVHSQTVDGFPHPCSDAFHKHGQRKNLEHKLNNSLLLSRYFYFFFFFM